MCVKEREREPLTSKTSGAERESARARTHMRKERNMSRLRRIERIESGRDIRSMHVVPSIEKMVRELVENAIDANASNVVVDVSNPASENVTISVRDDGDGIDDMKWIGTAMATSKRDQNHGLRQCGFRGESLKAICAVAAVNVTTRTVANVEGEGRHKSIVRGTVVASTTLSNVSERGTVVTVSEIFKNVPVRRRILQNMSASRLFRDLKELMRSYAIGHASLSFKLRGPRRRTMIDINTSVAGSTIHDRLRYIYDVNTSKVMRRASVSFPPFEIDVHASIASLSSLSSAPMLFVNGRPMCRRATRRFLNKTRHRVFDGRRRDQERFSRVRSTRLACPSVIVDVRCKDLARTLGHRDAIMKNDMLAQLIHGAIRSTRNRNSGIMEEEEEEDRVAIELGSNQTLRTPPQPFTPRIVDETFSAPVVNPSSAEKRLSARRSSSTTIRLKTSMIRGADILACVNKQFIVARCSLTNSSIDERVLLCFDQHAVHERIRYEYFHKRLEDRVARGQIDTHAWLPWVSRNISVAEANALHDQASFLCRWGFHIKVERRTTSSPVLRLIRSPKILNVPMTLPDLLEFSERLCVKSDRSLRTKPPAVIRLLQSKACRGAIMFGDDVSMAMAKSLLSKLSDCELPFQCAHGRPNTHVLSKVRRPPTRLRRRSRRSDAVRAGSLLGLYNRASHAECARV